MGKLKVAYSEEEDTTITAQAVVNIVRSTQQGVDPVPFVAALLEGFAERVRTLYAQQGPLQKPLYPFLFANPPKGWTGPIPDNWREKVQAANEARRQRALAVLSSDEVQDALEMTGQIIVSEEATDANR